jgi:hypothetical protein
MYKKRWQKKTKKDETFNSGSYKQQINNTLTNLGQGAQNEFVNTYKHTTTIRNVVNTPSHMSK